MTLQDSFLKFCQIPWVYSRCDYSITNQIPFSGDESRKWLLHAPLKNHKRRRRRNIRKQERTQLQLMRLAWMLQWRMFIRTGWDFHIKRRAKNASGQVFCAMVICLDEWAVLTWKKSRQKWKYVSKILLIQHILEPELKSTLKREGKLSRGRVFHNLGPRTANTQSQSSYSWQASLKGHEGPSKGLGRYVSLNTLWSCKHQLIIGYTYDKMCYCAILKCNRVKVSLF